MSEVYEGEILTSAYAKYRIQHPHWIFDSIVDWCKDGSFLLAIDVGCGSGQSCQQLCHYFLSVIGLDISEDQITNAKSKYGYDVKIEFCVGQAENLSFLTVTRLTLSRLEFLCIGLIFPNFCRKQKEFKSRWCLCSICAHTPTSRQSGC
ncbi:hypothetical protein ACJMK2_013922 [Sinanodonta woodiana]|uniref:Methyltransferase domain-containing protein n=1 Tax=Sinanodonta woodiana TaxID=1069815 RepID=A0ABD3V1G8_SINWO